MTSNLKEIYNETKQVAVPTKKGKPQEFEQEKVIVVNFDAKNEMIHLILKNKDIKLVVNPAEAKTIIRGLSMAMDFYYHFKNNQK